MKFNDLFQKTIKYFPSEIDISEGKIIEETGGFRSESLFKARKLAESRSENEWEDLLIWNIYQMLHRKARSVLTAKNRT